MDTIPDNQSLYAVEFSIHPILNNDPLQHESNRD